MTGPLTDTLICSLCDVPISADELAQGLAVRVDSNLICPQCVDVLPAKQQLNINRFRALRGLAATTYAAPWPAHPERVRYTFTTAGNLTGHRRALDETGHFEAPPLPMAATRRPEARASLEVTAWPLRQRVLIAAGVIGGALLIGGLSLLLLRGGGGAPENGHSNAVIGAPVPATLTRDNFSPEPQRAWAQIGDEPTCPPEVRAAVLLGYRDALSAVLERTDAGAQARIRALTIPDGVEFRDLAAHRQELLLPTPVVDPPITPVPKPSTTPPSVHVPTTRTKPTANEPVSAHVVAPAVSPIAAATTTTTAPTQAQRWRGRIATAGAGRTEALDGSIALPMPWPVGAGPFHRSQRLNGARTVQVLALELDPATIADGGGVVVLVHPIANERTTLSCALGRSGRTPTPLATLTLSGAMWQPLVLPIDPATLAAATTATKAAGTANVQLVLSSEQQTEVGFLLGAVVTVAGRPPLASDLALSPSPLLLNEKDGENRLIEFIAAAVTARGRDWTKPREFDPARLQALIFSAPTPNTERLAEVVRAIAPRELQRQPVRAAPATPADFASVQASAKPLLGDDVHVALLMADAYAADALTAMIGTLLLGDAKMTSVKRRNGGFVPVVVFEAAAADPTALAQRQVTITACRERGVPVIDLSAVGVEPYPALEDSLRQLLYLIERHRRSLSP